MSKHDPPPTRPDHQPSVRAPAVPFEAAAEAFLAALVDSSDDAIVGKTLDGVIRSWNPAAERLFGYSAAEAVGQSITLIIPPERYDEEREILSRLRRGERIEHFETVRVTKDGHPVAISLTVSPIVDDDGRIVGASKIARDVGAVNQAREMLAASEARFRALADNIPQLAWMADPAGSIFWYNARWFAYTGTDLEETGGWGWRKVHHPDHVEGVEERFRAAIAAGTVWEDTFPLRRHDGSWRWFLSRAQPIRDADGVVTMWFGTNTDITDRGSPGPHRDTSTPGSTTHTTMPGTGRPSSPSAVPATGQPSKSSTTSWSPATSSRRECRGPAALAGIEKA